MNNLNEAIKNAFKSLDELERETRLTEAVETEREIINILGIEQDKDNTSWKNKDEIVKQYKQLKKKYPNCEIYLKGDETYWKDYGKKIDSTSLLDVIERDHSDESKNNVKESCQLKEEPIVKMEPKYDSRKSFYGKAKVDEREDGSKVLYSYGTPVVQIKDGKVYLLSQSRGYLGWSSSATTLRHVKDFLQQNGFQSYSVNELPKHYEVKRCGGSFRESKRIKEDIDSSDEDFELCCKQVSDALAGGWYHGLTSSERHWSLSVNGGDGNQFSPKFADIIAREVSYPVNDGNFSYGGLDIILNHNEVEDFNKDTLKRDLLKVGCDEKDIDKFINCNEEDDCEIEFYIDYDVDIDDLSEENADGNYYVESNKSNKSRKHLKEEKFDIADKEDVEKAKEVIEDNKDETKEATKIVDVDAETVDELKDSYIGNVILQCPSCRTFLYKKPSFLKKEESIKDDNGVEETKVIYNKDEECPHCGAKNGFDLIGQVATMDVEDDNKEISSTGEENVEVNDEVEVKETPVENEEDKEENKTFESLDERRFDRLINKYLNNIYENVDYYKTTSGDIDDDSNKLIIEGVIKFKTGKEKKTAFVFESKSKVNDIYKFTGLNETFSNSRRAFMLNARISNNTLKCESLKYNYKVSNALNESNSIKGNVELKEHKIIKK